MSLGGGRRTEKGKAWAKGEETSFVVYVRADSGVVELVSRSELIAAKGEKNKERPIA